MNHFYVTRGRGESNKSALAAYDLALLNAGFNHNIVPVSSIIPEDSQQVFDFPDIPIGDVVHCVQSRHSGVKGETISSGIAFAFGHAGTVKRRFGIVAEEHGTCSSDELKEQLRISMDEMAENRNMELEDITYSIETIENIPKEYATVVSVLLLIEGERYSDAVIKR